MHAATEEEGVFLVGEFFGPCDHLRFQREHRLQGDREVAQEAQIFGFLGIADALAHLADGQCEQEQAGELGGEGLGGGHADFDAGTRDVGELAFAHHGAGGDVADGQGVFHAHAACMLERGQRIRRFARL